MAKKPKAVRANTIKFEITKYKAFTGDKVRLVPIVNIDGSSTGPVTYKWYNGSAGDTEMIGETNPYLVVDVNAANGNKFNCGVSQCDTEVKTQTPAEVTFEVKPKGLERLFYAPARIPGVLIYSKIDWWSVVELVNCMKKVDSANVATGTENFSKVIVDRIKVLQAAGKLKMASTLYTHLMTLLEQGDISAQESRNGYDVFFHLRSCKDDIDSNFYGPVNQSGYSDQVIWWTKTP